MMWDPKSQSFVMDTVQYQKTRRRYELRMGPIHIHTFDSVMASILKERTKHGYYDYAR